MKAIRTSKIKISNPTVAIAENCSKFLAACNWISPIVFESKELDYCALSRKYYEIVRRDFGLSSQLTLSAFRTVTASHRSNKSKGLWREVKFKRSTYPVVWKRDFAMTKKGITFWGEPVTLQHPSIPNHTTWKGSRLKRCNGDWYLILTHEIEIPDIKAEGCIVGVDSGIKRLFTATNSKDSKTFFFHGGELNSRRQHIRQTRSQVQSVGSRSSHRLLQRLSGNEAAVTEHLLHCASKRLVAWAEKVGCRRIVMEELADIRTASISKGKNLRSKVHRWPYAQAQFFVKYKAAAKGIDFELVDPRNTSRGCPCCGYVDKRNRNALKFRCLRCGHSGDADRIASCNIRNRSVVFGQVLNATGTSNSPKSTEPFDIVTGVVAGVVKTSDAALVVV